MYFHHWLTLCCLGDARESWVLGDKRKRERKKKKQELNFLHSFTHFEKKPTDLYLHGVKLCHCLSAPFSLCGKRRGEQTLTPKDTEFQSTDSRVHNEILGCSHFLPLFGNELIGPGGCELSAMGLFRRKCFLVTLRY